LQVKAFKSVDMIHGHTTWPRLRRCPQLADIVQHGLHLKGATEVSVAYDAFSVDQERPSGVIHLTRRAAFHGQPKRLPDRLNSLRTTGHKRPGGEIGTVALGIGPKDRRGIHLRLHGDGEEEHVGAFPGGQVLLEPGHGGRDERAHLRARTVDEG
jgi:hypothetical protein